MNDISTPSTRTENNPSTNFHRTHEVYPLQKPNERRSQLRETRLETEMGERYKTNGFTY